MKRTAIIIIAIIFIGIIKSYAQEDTVGFWQIQYNGKEISPLTMNSEQTYLFIAINDTDKINIYYYTESPCSKCYCKLELRDESGKAVKTMERKGYGDNRSFPLSGKEIGPLIKKGRVYMYFSGKYDGWLPWVFMGALRMKQ